MSFDDLHKRNRELFDDLDESFDKTFTTTRKLAVGLAIFWGFVVLAVLGLATYVVLSLV